jgi:hypothetical protein
VGGEDGRFVSRGFFLCGLRGYISLFVCVFCLLGMGKKGNGVGSRVASGKVDSAHVFDVLATHVSAEYSNWI